MILKVRWHTLIWRLHDSYNHLKVTWQNSIDDRRNITLMEMTCPLHISTIIFNFYFNIKYQPSAWILVNLQPLNNLINKLDKWLIVHTYTNIQFDQHTDFRWLYKRYPKYVEMIWQCQRYKISLNGLSNFIQLLVFR